MTGIWQPWTAMKGQDLSNVEAETSSLNPVNLRDCMSDCLENKLSSLHLKCRSIRKSVSGTYCGLVSKRFGDGDVTTTNNATTQYFNRPAWYLGKILIQT